MANLTKGTRPQPYGQGGRKVDLPVKALKQIWEGAMVSQVSGACVTATDSGELGGVIGVAEHDMLGGAADGTSRISLMTDKIFVMTADATNAPTDATPYGAILYAVTDNTVGTSSLTATLPVAGRFSGIEDDGSVRVFIGLIGCMSGTP